MAIWLWVGRGGSVLGTQIDIKVTNDTMFTEVNYNSDPTYISIYVNAINITIG